MIAVIPAIANAIAHAIGVRFYELPDDAGPDHGGACHEPSRRAPLSLTDQWQGGRTDRGARNHDDDRFPA